MYKLIVLDLDGTLLNSEKKISPGNLAALKMARENGALIAFSTARSAGAMREYIAAVQPDILISNGGALVERNGETLFNRQLSWRAYGILSSGALSSRTESAR